MAQACPMRLQVTTNHCTCKHTDWQAHGNKQHATCQHAPIRSRNLHVLVGARDASSTESHPTSSALNECPNRTTVPSSTEVTRTDFFVPSTPPPYGYTAEYPLKVVAAQSEDTGMDGAAAVNEEPAAACPHICDAIPLSFHHISAS